MIVATRSYKKNKKFVLAIVELSIKVVLVVQVRVVVLEVLEVVVVVGQVKVGVVIVITENTHQKDNKSH